MDSIRLGQINEVLNYDKNINSMVFKLEKKRVAMSPDPIVVPYSQVNAEALTAAKAALDQLRVLLDSKRASLSLMIRPGSRIESQEFASGASDVGQVAAGWTALQPGGWNVLSRQPDTADKGTDTAEHPADPEARRRDDSRTAEGP